MNYGDQVIVFDMRSTFQILRAHLNYNHKNDSLIPIPYDYLLQNDLEISKYLDWLPSKLLTDPDFLKCKLVNKAKQQAIQRIKRYIVFVIGSNHQSIEQFKIQKIFRPKYGEDVLGLNNLNVLSDYVTLRNAVLLVDALKAQQNVFREVYLVRDGHRNLEHCFSYLCKSKLERFKTRNLKPPKNRPALHTGLKFIQYYPCSILQGRLFLGDANHASQTYVIRNMRISHIANITDVVSNNFDNDIDGISYIQI